MKIKADYANAPQWKETTVKSSLPKELKCLDELAHMSPTFEVTEDVFETTVDGVKMVFQLTPDTESPAEMNTYLPD